MSEISFSEGTATEVLDGLHESASDLRTGLTRGAVATQDLILVARFGADVVGYLAAERKRNGLLVWEHVVVPDFRNRGVGRRLLLEAARRIVPRAVLTIDPTGDFAIDQVADYYRGLGFPATADDEFKISVRAHKVVDAIGERLEEDTTIEAVLRRKRMEPVTIGADATIVDALGLLTTLKIGSVVVTSDGDTIEGVLSERDIVVGLHERGAGFLETHVRDHMTTEVVAVEMTDVIADVMELVTLRRLRHLPVTKDGKLVGVVSVGDLLMFRMREHDMRRDVVPHRARR